MIYERPKNEIFASDAKTGEIVEFPNIKRGWGVTENLGFIPPMEYFNAAFNRVDKALAYQLQRGVSEWSAEEEYPMGAVSVFNSKLYQAKVTNTNKKPPDDKDAWDVIASEAWSEQTFLKKTDAAVDSTKLGGLAADKYAKKDNIPSEDLIREFSHTATTKELPDGDYGSSDFWKNIKPGIYYATREKGSNKPENCGLVEVVSNGEISVTWSYGGNTYRWYKYFNNSTSAWRRLAISGENALPAGIIIVSARASTPDGFLLCDGSALSRTSYSTLFEAIGTAYGAGNGSTTFNIPDLRGEFIRGVDNGRGVDAGRALGSAQGDAIRNITGWFNTWANDRKDSGGVFRIEKDIGTGSGDGTSDPVWKVVFEPERLVPVSNENRPRNISVNFYIKY